jgi:antitoxin VapB
MSERDFARIFKYGRSQAFRLPDDRAPRGEGGILPRPFATDLDAWFQELDRFVDIPFMEEGRRQPAMPEPEALFE